MSTYIRSIVELIIVLAISRVVWILVVLCTTGSLAIFGLTKFLRMAYNPPEVQQGDNIAGANLTALNYTVAT